MSEFLDIKYDFPINQSNVIKVIGVGGGGSNAVNHMFKQGIKGVDFVVCNTDAQALQNSPVPNKIQLGITLTEGLGAGANPEIGQQAALESIQQIDAMLNSNTKMVFITAGMGGGTGTGAAPIIAQLAKEKGILTVGIVTNPFDFEGAVRTNQAKEGVERLRKQVDSLVIINNNKLTNVYGNLSYKAGFSKADEVLTTASKGISEVITHHYHQNIDLRDAQTVLANSGTAIMGSSIASGKDRAKNGVMSAIDSPLLNDNKIKGAKNVLLLIVSGSEDHDQVTIDEINEINSYIQSEAQGNVNIIMGVGEDEKLGDSIAITVIATGFSPEQQEEIINSEQKKIIHALEEDQKVTHDFQLDGITISNSNTIALNFDTNPEPPTQPQNLEVMQQPTLAFEVVEVSNPEVKVPQAIEAIPTPVMDLVPSNEYIKNIEVAFEIISTQQTPVFEIITPQIKEIEVREPELVADTNSLNFAYNLFDAAPNMPLEVPPTQQPITNFNTIDQKPTNPYEQNLEETKFQVTEPKIIRHTLDDYLEIEKELLESKPVAEKTNAPEPIDEALNFQVKNVEAVQSVVNQPVMNQIPVCNPMNMSIDDALKLRTEARKDLLRDYNHKFMNPSRIDEINRIPTFQRLGIDIDSNNSDLNNKSRLSIGTDSNDDSQLRHNNSYLHDNVD